MLKWNNVPIPPQHLVGLVLGGVAQSLFPRALSANPLVADLIGLPLIAAGMGLAVWSVRAAGEIDIESPDKLLVSGPYSFIRNPMYVGWALLYLGIAFVVNSVWIAALLVPVAAFTHFFEVRQEERVLGEQFGDDYVEYQGRVRRYI
ncbi:methyltransferase family protein [Chloroflexota bacterium]